jgi:hypothetical protein
VVETVSLDDLRYSYYGSKPPSAVGTAPAIANAAPVVRRPVVRPRPAPIVSRATQAVRNTSTVSVTRGTDTRDYEVGGYAQ